MSEERKCIICGDVLSRYNKFDTCFRHTDTAEAIANLAIEKHGDENKKEDRSHLIDRYIKHYWKL